LIEEDYATRLNKLSKFSLGRDEIGDLAASLQNVLAETAQQASYHQALSTELKQGMEQPTAESGVRLGNLKKGLQGSVERSYRNKGLQEGHVLKVRRELPKSCIPRGATSGVSWTCKLTSAPFRRKSATNPIASSSTRTPPTPSSYKAKSSTSSSPSLTACVRR
jgi:hypothetical protein